MTIKKTLENNVCYSHAAIFSMQVRSTYKWNDPVEPAEMCFQNKSCVFIDIYIYTLYRHTKSQNINGFNLKHSAIRGKMKLINMICCNAGVGIRIP